MLEIIIMLLFLFTCTIHELGVVTAWNLEINKLERPVPPIQQLQITGNEISYISCCHDDYRQKSYESLCLSERK